MNNQNKSFLWLIIFLIGFPQISETIYTPSLADLAKTFHVSGNQIQQTLGIYFIGFAIGVFCWGIISDFIGRKSSMLCGILLYILGSYLCLISKSLEFLLFSRFIQAFGAAAGSNVSQTILRDVCTDKERMVIFSKISAVLAFSPAIGPLLGSVVAEIWNVSMVFKLLLLIGVLAFLWSSISLKETLNRDIKITDSYKSIVISICKDRYFWLYGTLIGTINGVIFSYYGEAPFIFIEDYHFSIIEYGCIGFIVAAACFSGANYCRKKIGLIDAKQILNKGNLFFFTGIAVLFILNFLPLKEKVSVSFLLGGIFLMMFGLSVILPICLSNALNNHKAYLGIAGALLGLFYYCIVGGLTIIMSMLHGTSAIAFPLFLFFCFLMNAFVISRLK
ncbi:multidrug effflux MFS transporter [Empedobacter brevis]|uniref:multidrug effflux MFS transporter n=1 Tax=Empedobacter brevis TaxID=247 RepID=UPI0028AC0686|nr:multidrug effflux MFS transporter [Empedobacter brevis]